ncbi:unnamed protein product [Cuscuta campestris]|uniref:Uncharacterized protein n=1 Tax=Cuscuta campestris TaxID=132261 RepID=A0A484LSD4_9ASTE|nr:unnamed protein product [Cuscuta campestris]
MNYQARMGMLAGGAYGLPQFCMRVFLWGALQGEKLSQFPLPAHKVDSRGVISKEFECNNVDYENHDVNLKDTLFLEDAISDLPKVENTEGFPDYYKLCGSIKDKYTQVGNAVVFLVAKALGYSLAVSFKGLSEAAAMFTLPEGYGAIQELPADQTTPSEFP